MALTLNHAEALDATATDALERYRAGILAHLRDAVGVSSDPPYPLMRYHLGWEDRAGNPVEGRGGKLLRPALLLLSCESAGGDWEAALPAAAAVELLHNFSLLHDDVEDESEQRHGRDTAWRVWGKAEAINAGDGMFALAFGTMLQLIDRGHPAPRVLQAAQELQQATLFLCEGQHSDLRMEGAGNVSLSDYLTMIEGKTAALLDAACGIGALLAGAPPGVVRSFKQYGRQLGLAFQIRDDVLGCWGDALQTGKSSNDDIRAGKRSYPVVVALNRASDEERARLALVLGNHGALDTEVGAARTLMEKLDARNHGQRAAREHANAAIDALRDLSLGDHRAELEALARFAAERSA